MAVSLLELADALERGEALDAASGITDKNKKERTPQEMREEATKLMEKVPNLRQKIAGKSIPLEVCNPRSTGVTLCSNDLPIGRNSSLERPENISRNSGD